ncbi:MAG TPA: hypothetical protein ENH87_11115 [Pricia antarctica]|uniref:CHAP domain-containing protein n=1 Tax=Pricia antarctica TaxID=641691 RepID=A0A831QRP4_9FLAO|nr:hypothetical protein [Pricia antarctica]
MASVPKLLDAIGQSYDVYSHGTFEKVRASGVATYCNLFVSGICGFYKYDKFLGLLANDIIEVIENDKEWDDSKNPVLTKGMGKAQHFANQGCVVLAYSKGEEHGHVCIIRPGLMVYSNKWKMWVPKCVSIGKNNFTGKGINWAFSDRPHIAFLVRII